MTTIPSVEEYSANELRRLFGIVSRDLRDAADQIDRIGAGLPGATRDMPYSKAVASLFRILTFTDSNRNTSGLISAAVTADIARSQTATAEDGHPR